MKKITITASKVTKFTCFVLVVLLTSLNRAEAAPAAVPGCNDPAACNYDPAATSNDGSCQYIDACGICGGGGTTSGCTIQAACNYDPSADCNDGSCLLADPVIQWQNGIGGSSADEANAIQQTADGGYIVGGSSMSGISGDKTEAAIGSFDLWVVKLDAMGTIQWQNTIGGSGLDALKDIEQTTDGGYIIGAYSESGVSGDKSEPTLGTSDYWVIKLDAFGAIEWENTIGGSGSEDVRSVAATADGGCILSGNSDSDISGDKTEDSLGWDDYWVVKLNALGAIEWQNTMGGSNSDIPAEVLQMSDGTYVVAGVTQSGVSSDISEPINGAADYWIVKLSATGSILWDKSYGGALYDKGTCAYETADGGVIIGGYSDSGASGDKTEPSQGGWDYWVLKLDASGNLEWEKTAGGSGDDRPRSIVKTLDGGYVLGGRSNSPVSGDKTEPTLGSGDWWVVKLDAGGGISWNNSIGGSGFEMLWSVAPTSEGGYVLGGSSTSGISGEKTEASQGISDMWIVKFGHTNLQGCVDAAACNYDPSATCDDGSCTYAALCYNCDGTLNCIPAGAVQGCTYPTACNYNPAATIDLGNCIFPQVGEDCNGNLLCPPAANPGCTYPGACNFDATADEDDGSCTYPQTGYDCAGNCTVDNNVNGTCDLLELLGCTYDNAQNYNPAATADDGTCDFACEGDYNGDGLINSSDLLNFLGLFGSACP